MIPRRDELAGLVKRTGTRGEDDRTPGDNGSVLVRDAVEEGVRRRPVLCFYASSLPHLCRRGDR